MSKDFYKILGVEKSANADELKKAYRQMALKYHPDRNKDDKAAEAKFKEVNEAYDVLKDPQKRAAYDQFGTTDFAAGGGGRQGPDFSSMGGSFSDIFEGMFGDFMNRGGQQKTGPQRGSDLQYTMEITLEEAFTGKESTIKIPINETCDKCTGSGAMPGTGEEKCPTCDGQGRMRMQQGFFTIERTCPTCQGAGKIIREACDKCGGKGAIRREKTLKVKIPQGVDTGRRIRLTGEGEGGTRGGAPGDLYILLAIKPHKFFQREGTDLYCRVPIPMTKAALGGDLEVPTVDGKKTRFSIKAGTQNGQRVRLKGKGMPIMKSDQSGDMYVELQVEVPVNLTKKQQELMRQLDQTMTGKEALKHSPEASGFFSKMKELWDDLKD